MEIPRIAYDESGNTGQNLLDSSQPYFVLASVYFSEIESDEIFKIFDSTAKEVHFKTLKKYNKSRNQILQFCNLDLISSQKIKYFVANKKIALIGHIVDRFIEPVMFNIGKDIYKDRSNIIITNLLYTFGEKSWNKDFVDEFYSSFQKLVRNPNDASIEDFYKKTNKLNNSLEKKDGFLSIIEKSKNIKIEILESINPYIIDLTFPTFNVLADDWFKELNSRFSIIHDNSKAIEYWKNMIVKLSDSGKMEEKEVGFGQIKMSYPLKYTNVELVESKDYKQIQIADLVASSICYGLNNQHKINEDQFVKALWASRLFNIFHHSIRAIDGETMEKYILEGDQEGINPLDYFVEMHIKQRNKKTL